MAFDVRPFDRDLIRSHIDGADNTRQSHLHDEKASHKDDCLLVSQRPNQRERREDGNNKEPAQRERNFLIHVIRAGHERVRVE